LLSLQMSEEMQICRKKNKKVAGPIDSRQNLQGSLYKLSKATTVMESAACIDHVKGTAENMKNMDCICLEMD
jgi:hypothetical protein